MKKQAGGGEIVQRLQHKLTNKTHNNTYDTIFYFYIYLTLEVTTIS